MNHASKRRSSVHRRSGSPLRLLLLLFVLASGLLLYACDSGETESTTTPSATASETSETEADVPAPLKLDYSRDRYPYSGQRDLVIGNEAAYLVYGERLLQSNADYTRWRPLCEKPDCRHDDDSCDALARE